MLTIRSAAVLGAGTMGAQIAAHLANAGVPTLLFDLTPEAARDGLARARTLKPDPFFTPDAAGLVTTLKGSGPFTVFAPTDAAFAKLPAGTVEELLKPENKEKLMAILTYHVVPGAVMAEKVTQLSEAKTVNGAMVKISAKNGKVMINDANVVTPNIETSNGVIHVIDRVILPPST